MSSAPTDCRVPVTPDPADKLDAKADGAFGSAGTTTRRGGSFQLDQAMYWGRKGGTLHTGEGALLVQEIERLRKERDAIEEMYRHHVAVALDAIAKLNHAQGILSALREPSDAVILAAIQCIVPRCVTTMRDTQDLIRAIVAAAERGA